MTANDISKIPGPLRDRMEIIHIAGYTPHEKLQIAKRYLIEKGIKGHGLGKYSITIPDKMYSKIISCYTREAGVRELERLVNTCCRKIATEIVIENIGADHQFVVTEKLVKKYLGPEKWDRSNVESNPQVGLVNGLAWTSVGGELLNIEVVTVPGTGKLSVTGKLGEVMQESAKTALSYVRSIGHKIGVNHDWYNKNDIHIHVPEGATPKDGPSAGITMATALCSAIANIPVKQSVAMTGEITLRGRVLPIGGLKEKLLAAKQAGVKQVVIPEKNEKDLAKIPQEIKSGLEIFPCRETIEVFKVALDLARPDDFMKVVDLRVVENTETSVPQEVAN
jgi:ATP-dependent Lon protease